MRPPDYAHQRRRAAVARVKVRREIALAPRARAAAVHGFENERQRLLYRFVLRAPDGSEIAFNGVYREIASPSRLVCTQVFEAMPDHPTLVTLIFEELDSGTKMTETILHETAAARDAHVASGMEGGASESMDRLDELLRAMR
jgi:uncharacterized protein YndB with AHSA1/START domain